MGTPVGRGHTDRAAARGLYAGGAPGYLRAMPILRLVAAAGLLLAGCGGDCPETAPVTSNQTSGGSAGRVPMLEAGCPSPSPAS
jgi:hypothetical protein